MLEPILMSLDEPPQWIDTSVPEVKAAVLRTAKGALVLPIWLGKGSQYVPGQAAVAKLTMVVPHIPQTMQAWDVHPADIHNLRCERVVGGTKVTHPGVRPDRGHPVHRRHEAGAAPAGTIAGPPAARRPVVVRPGRL